jgi:hypothetical protein
MTTAPSQGWARVRATTWCPMCGDKKRQGQIMCLPCHYGFKDLGHGDYPQETKARLDMINEKKDLRP